MSSNHAWLLLVGLSGACTDPAPPCDPDAPGTICTIAGSTRNEGYAGDGGPARDAVLYIPMDSVIGPDGNVWFIDFNNYVVRSIDPDGIIQTMVGSGELGDSPAAELLSEMPALESNHNHTPTMVMHGDYLYLAAWHASRINRIRLSDMMLENFAGAGLRTSYTGDGGPAREAAVDLPSAITFDPAGNLVFTDQSNTVIRRIEMATNTVSTIVGKCVIEERSCTNNNTSPVPCPNSNKFTCGDPATSCSGAALCSGAFAGDGGPATEARLNLPQGQAADPVGRIAYDRSGNLLIADTNNNRIRKVDPSGVITTIAGTGKSGYSGDGGPATEAQLNRPVDISVGDDNTIFVSDTFNSCIRKIDPAGVITTVAGTCSPNARDRGFSGDGGPATEAKMDRPYGIDVVGTKLYVSDSYNNRFRVVNLQ